MDKNIYYLIVFLFICSCGSGGSSEDSNIDNPPDIIIAFGNSITRGGDPTNEYNTGIKGYVPYLQDRLPENIILNCGVGGETSKRAIVRFDDIIFGEYSDCTKDIIDGENTKEFYDYSIYEGIKPEKILIILGTNDILQNLSDTQSNLIYMINYAIDNDVEPYISTIPPILDYENEVDNINQIIKDIADSLDIPLVDSYAEMSPAWDDLRWDKLHLNDEGNIILAELWANAIIGGVNAIY